MRLWIAAVVGAVLIAGLPAAAIVLAAHETTGNDATTTAAEGDGPRHGNGHGNGHGHGHGDGRSDGTRNKEKHKDQGTQKDHARDGDDDGTGSRGDRGAPPWARGHVGGFGGPGAGSRFGQLTPQQRTRLMARLAREHAAAVQKWAACVQDLSGADLQKIRDTCGRPVPPGWAKRHQP